MFTSLFREKLSPIAHELSEADSIAVKAGYMVRLAQNLSEALKTKKAEDDEIEERLKKLRAEEEGLRVKIEKSENDHIAIIITRPEKH